MRLRFLPLCCFATAAFSPLFSPVLFAAPPMGKIMAGPKAKSDVVATFETEPDFVFRASFRMTKPAGSTRIMLDDEDAASRRVEFKGDIPIPTEGKVTWSYALDLSPKAVTISEFGTSKATILGKSPAVYTNSNEIQIVRRGSLLRVILNDRVLLETKQAVHTTTRLEIRDPDEQFKLLKEPRLQPTEEIYLTDD